MAGEPEIVWGHASGPEPEIWTGTCATREEAIDEGRDAYDGEAFYVTSGHRSKPSAYLPAFLSEDILERMGERAGEECGESAEDWPGTTSVEADQELTELLTAWADKHLTVDFWHASGTPEKIESEARNGR